MRTYCIAMGILLGALWWPKWEGNLKKSGYMHTYDWVTLLYRNKLTRHCKSTILQQFFFFLRNAAAAAAKSLQSCPTLCDPINGSPPGSAIPGILQARTQEVGCHFLLQCMKVKSESEVAQSEYAILSQWSGQKQKWLQRSHTKAELLRIHQGFPARCRQGWNFNYTLGFHIIPLVKELSAYFPQNISSSQASSGVNNTGSAPPIIFSLATLDWKVIMRGLMYKNKPANAKLWEVRGWRERIHEI